MLQVTHPAGIKSLSVISNDLSTYIESGKAHLII